MQLESLEDRRLLAVDVLANIDIENNANFIPRDVSPFGLTGQVIFRGNDGNTGPEPWVTTGTAESTVLLKDIRDGQFGSGARDFIEFNGRLYFSADNGTLGLELWVSDGTRATTNLIADIWPSAEPSAPTELTVFQDSLYFFANDGESGRELYRFDGVFPERVADSVEGRSGASGVNLTVVGDKMFFDSESVEGSVSGLWVSDGTAEGTVPLTIPGINNNDISLMTPFGDQLVFASRDRLWVSDGTEAGSRQIEPVGDNLFEPSSVVVNGDRLYVVDSLGLHEISDSLGSSTTIAATAQGATESDGKVYYWDANGFYVLSPDNQATRLLPFNSFFGAEMGGTFNIDGGMIFNARQTLNRYQIWVTDGTLEGTEMLETVTDDSAEPLADFQQVGDHIYFRATNGNFHESVWTIPAPTIEVTDPPSIPGDVNQDDVVDSFDIDALYAALAVSDTDERFDVNEDGAVTSLDVDFLIENTLQTRRGDLDLNGQVQFADFLQLSASFGQSEATWSDGDSDGDGTVSFADFLALSANFGFDRDA